MKQILLLPVLMIFVTAFAQSSDVIYECTFKALDSYMPDFFEFVDSFPDTIYIMGGEELKPTIKQGLKSYKFNNVPFKIISSTPYAQLNGTEDELFINKIIKACEEDEEVYVFGLGYDLVKDTLIVKISNLNPTIYNDIEKLDWYYDTDEFEFVYDSDSLNWTLR